MSDNGWFVEQFEAHRNHLQAVAYRMLGSAGEAEVALQESWIRFTRSDISGVENMGGWLTTIVSRVCLDLLRKRKLQRGELSIVNVPEPVSSQQDGSNPEYEAVLADSVGVAMLVVLGNLNPAERIAFVLHDVFDLSFSEIAPIVGRTEVATRQLASRARRRVRGAEKTKEPAEFEQKRELVEAFLTASRTGDFEKLLNVLDPNVVLRNDTAFAPVSKVPVVYGSQDVAKQFAGRAQDAHSMLVNGSVGAVVAPQGQLLFVLELKVEDGKISEIEMIADQERLQKLELANIKK